jgi:hypothetical protein
MCEAISDRADMFDKLLVDLDKMFAECSHMMADVIRKKENHKSKKKLTSSDFTENELKLLAVTRSLAGAVKSVIDTPILSDDGTIDDESEKVYNEAVKGIPEFRKKVEEVESIQSEMVCKSVPGLLGMLTGYKPKEV